MPFERPTLEQLFDLAKSEINARLPGADAIIRRSNLEVLARVAGGAAHLQHGYLSYLSRQLFPDTAEAEHLARWAAVWGIARKGAVEAAGDAVFTGVDGARIPAGTTLQRGDEAEFATTADATVQAGSANAEVRAALPGAAGNSGADTALQLVSPVAGIDATAKVAAAGLTGGADGESDESLRARLLDRIRRPPQGGAARDYVAWALEVPGVTRAWVAPQEQGIGTVTLRFVTDDAQGGPIPVADKVTEVSAYIAERRPVTAEVFVVAPTSKALDFTIQLTPDTVAVRQAVEAELRDLLRRAAAPGATILISHIREAVSIAAGETDNVVSVPAANVDHGPGEMAVFGVVTWI